jgi:predicted AlkP superfamily pyrophosphatase or phosphodiesterase
MKEKTLIFFIDAARPDYINQKTTPFLFNFKNNNTFLKAESLLGYSAGIHPTIMNSVYQEKHEHFLVYSFDPVHSEFAWMKYLKILPSLLRRFLIASLKAPFYWSNNKSKFPNWYKKKILPLPASIDPNQAKFFKTENTLYSPLFFKLLKQNKVKYFSCADNDHPIYGKGFPIKEWKLTNNFLDFYFSYEVDPIGHYSGPKSKEIKQIMNLIDKQIAKIYNEAKQKYKKVNLFVFSDHGMVEIKDTVNVKQVLDKSDLKPIKDYIVFYDSTMVRFWTKNKDTQKKIIKILSKVQHLTYLDDKIKAKYKIRFKTRKWGDLMFLADPGYRIFPDYFAPVRFNTKGMHGYWPEYEEGKGIFITNAFKTKKKGINVVDFMPTMLKAMGLKKLIPKNIDGKPIF